MPCLRINILTQNDDLRKMLSSLKKERNLSQMVALADEISKSIAVKLVEQELEKRNDEKVLWPDCPNCKRKIENKGTKERKIKAIIGTVKWDRKIGRCPNNCEAQIVPMDEELGIFFNQRTSINLKKCACALSVFTPYQTAKSLLMLLQGVNVSAKSIFNWCQHFGAKASQKIEEELANMQKGISPELQAISRAERNLPLAVGGDGVFVPFRPDGSSPKGSIEWHEVKVGIFARIEKKTNKKGKEITKLLNRRLVAFYSNTPEDFEERMALEAEKQGIKQSSNVAWISDGGKTYWNVFYNCFWSYAVGILDFYHVAENISKATKAFWDEMDKNSEVEKIWFKRLRHQIRHGEVYSILEEIIFVLDTYDMTDKVRKSLCNLYTYLHNHIPHLDYPSFKKQGFPIGSGMVESACKWLIQQRFKCTGMRWSEAGFNNLLHLRLTWTNERFDQLFEIPP